MENIDKWISITGTIVGALMVVATIITGLTKSERDDFILSRVKYVFNKLFSFTTYSDAQGTFKLPLMDPARGVQTPIKQKKQP